MTGFTGQAQIFEDSKIRQGMTKGGTRRSSMYVTLSLMNSITFTEVFKKSGIRPNRPVYFGFTSHCLVDNAHCRRSLS